MKSAWKSNGPLVIGGIGGSGTRLVAEICMMFGINLGDDLNRANDNLLYTLLFRRTGWFYKSYQDPKLIKTGLSLLEKLLLKHYFLSPQELWFLLYAAADMSLHYRDERSWSLKRIINLIKNPRFKKTDFVGWGWKEPNSYLILEYLNEYFPSLKFIHTIRHGADMAFSSNQRQLRAWGMMYNVPHPEEERPASSLKYWAKANQSVAEIGKGLGKDRYLQINYDQLCLNPDQSINDIIAFLGLNIDEKTYQAALDLPIVPSSLGRYKLHDLSQLDPEDLAVLNEFGFKLEN
jgi:hypothetical protein